MGDRHVCCSNEATFGGFLGGFQMPAGHEKGQAILIMLRIFSPTPASSGKDRELEMELMIDLAYMIKPV